jgi:glutamyl-tRNA synthetase/glutamyl-Q tRNA(Asp) synthetase
VVTRFAPAPTGYLHLGHVANAIYVWGMARAHDGRVLLRIEDHDRERSRAEYEQEILDDLEWLGFVPDAPSIAAFRRGPCEGRQSERGAIYEAALARLRDRGLVYACDCSRAAIRAAVEASLRGTSEPGTQDAELWYPGTCCDRRLAETPGRGVRARLEPSIERFDDLRHGWQEQRPSEQCGDLLARDRHGNWTYQFAATVDDLVQGVTLVVRGDDLLASTGRQMQLARLLGRTEPPRFLHHPLIMKSPSQKLSKSDGDTGVRDLRRLGMRPEQVIGRAAFLVGLIDRERPVAAADVAALPFRITLDP